MKKRKAKGKGKSTEGKVRGGAGGQEKKAKAKAKSKKQTNTQKIAGVLILKKRKWRNDFPTTQDLDILYYTGIGLNCILREDEVWDTKWSKKCVNKSKQAKRQLCVWKEKRPPGTMCDFVVLVVNNNKFANAGEEWEIKWEAAPAVSFIKFCFSKAEWEREWEIE